MILLSPPLLLQTASPDRGGAVCNTNVQPALAGKDKFCAWSSLRYGQTIRRNQRGCRYHSGDSCLPSACYCYAAAARCKPPPSPSHRGTLPSQGLSPAPAQTQAPEESDMPEKTVQPAAEPTPEPAPTPDPTPKSTPTPEPKPTPTRAPQTGVLNTNTKKIHYPSCSSVDKIAFKNYAASTVTLDELLSRGYSKCGRCF